MLSQGTQLNSVGHRRKGDMRVNGELLRKRVSVGKKGGGMR